MNKISLISIVGALATFQAASAGETVTAGPYGQGNAVTYFKPTPQQTTVALYHHRGVGYRAPSESRPERTSWETVAVGNSFPVTFQVQQR